MYKLDKDFQEVLDKYEELNKELQHPDVTNNQKRFAAASKKLNFLTPIYQNVEKYSKLISFYIQAEELLDESDNDEMKELARIEIDELQEEVDSLKQEIDEQLATSDPNDSRDVIVEIRAGTGGEEAALFASDLFRMYSRYIESKNWKIQLLNTNYTGNGGFKEVVFGVSGETVFGKLRFESGVHRVQRVPATESSGRIHTSAASVVVLPEVEDVDVEINPADIKIDVYRSSGPGGQSVNTTDSAVRLTHEPTGIVVTCQDEKSQHKNKARAITILKSKLYEIEMEKQASETSDLRQSSIKSGDRSVKIRTYNYPDGRVTDHRIKKTWYNLQNIIDGDLEEVIEVVGTELRKKD